MTTAQKVVALLLAQSAAAIPSSHFRLATVSSNAGTETAPRGALLETDTQTQHSKANPASWFGGFSQGESTYNYDGKSVFTHDRNVLDGWNPKYSDDAGAQVRSAEWFVETPSGGSKQAWQTMYPAVSEGTAGNNVETGKWFKGADGMWQQQYISESNRGGEDGNILASWFDSNVRQVDGFGREKLPGIGSPRNFLEWEERSVNTTLACKDPGCTANVSLLAPFDAAKGEIFKNCRLSVSFYPTDFDDQYSGEGVEWIQVNDKQVNSNCRPLASGCNATAQRPLLPCVNDIAIDHLIPQNGVFSVAAKIPKVVDECPHNGNLLSAIPMVTCLVSKKTKVHKPKPVKAQLQTKDGDTLCTTSMPLQCATRGCAAEISVPINDTCAHIGACTLSINVSQTDFDNGEGNSELIEYIKIDGEKVAGGLNPGQNPCRTAWKGTGGKPAQRSDYNFAALSNHSINLASLSYLTSGKILIEGKISEYVDECASNGYLFDAIAHVTCKGQKKTTSLLSQGRASRFAAA